MSLSLSVDPTPTEPILKPHPPADVLCLQDTGANIKEGPSLLRLTPFGRMDSQISNDSLLF